MTGDFFSYQLPESDWDLANEFASHLVTYLDVDPSVARMYRVEAIGALAFAKFAEHHYLDEVWEWPTDFRENPRMDPTDEGNALHPRFPERNIGRFHVGDNTVTVSLVDDPQTFLCAHPEAVHIRADADDAAVVVQGAIDPEESFITFYGATPAEHAMDTSFFANAEVTPPNRDAYDDLEEYHQDLTEYFNDYVSHYFWSDRPLPQQVHLLDLPTAREYESGAVLRNNGESAFVDLLAE